MTTVKKALAKAARRAIDDLTVFCSGSKASVKLSKIVMLAKVERQHEQHSSRISISTGSSGNAGVKLFAIAPAAYQRQRENVVWRENGGENGVASKASVIEISA